MTLTIDDINTQIAGMSGEDFAIAMALGMECEELLDGDDETGWRVSQESRRVLSLAFEAERQGGHQATAFANALDALGRPSAGALTILLYVSAYELYCLGREYRQDLLASEARIDAAVDLLIPEDPE